MDVCLQQHRHGLYLTAMIDLVTFKCNIWSQMKQRIVRNMDVACLGCMVDFSLQSGKNNTAHLLCIRISQYAPLPILEIHITPLHVTEHTALHESSQSGPHWPVLTDDNTTWVCSVSPAVLSRCFSDFSPLMLRMQNDSD